MTLPEVTLDQAKLHLTSYQFWDIALEDYLVARWAYANNRGRQFYWSSQQCLEKLLKLLCVVQSMPVKKTHCLKEIRKQAGLDEKSKPFSTKLRNPHKPDCTSLYQFILHVNKLGRTDVRYAGVTITPRFGELERLDQTVYELVALAYAMCTANFPKANLNAFMPVHPTTDVVEIFACNNEYFKVTGAAESSLISFDPAFCSTAPAQSFEHNKAIHLKSVSAPNLWRSRSETADLSDAPEDDVWRQAYDWLNDLTSN